MFRQLATRASIAALLLGSTAAFAAPGFVAGLLPDQRPAGAPVKADSPPTSEQMARYLKGVEGTPPGNVTRIVGTGHWWVPMRHPGMTPPYDPRGWHSAPAAAAPATR